MAVRGGAHSQSGHTVVRDGLVLDTSKLGGIIFRDDGLLECGAGVTWGDVLAAVRGSGFVPPVLTASAVPKVRVNGRSEDVIFFDGVFFESSLKSIFFAS